MVKKFNNNNKFIKGTKPVLTPADKSKLTSVVAAFKKSRSPAFLPVHGGLTFSKTENNTMQRGRALAADKYIFAPRQRQNLASELFGSPQRALRGGGNIWAKNDILPRTGHDAYHGSYFNFIGLKKVNLIGFGKQMEARGDTLFEKWYSGAVKVSMLGNKLRKKHHYADSRVLFKKKEASIDFYPYYYREKFAYSRKFSRRMGAIDRFFARAFAKFRLGAVKEALRRGNLRAYWTSYAGWFQTMGLESDVTSEKTFKVGSRYLAVRNYDRSGISIRKRRLKDYEIEFYKDVKAGKRPYIDNEYRKEAQRKELIFDAWSYPGHTGVGRDEKVESADFRLSNLTYITGVMSDYHMSRIFIGPFYKFLRRAFTSVKRVMARTEKNKRPQKRKIGAKKLKISSRLARSIFYIASNSVAKAVHSRRDSPFLSTRHLMYNLANPFADDAENPAVNYHSLRANIMLSRHMFLNRRGRRMRVAAVREKTKQLTE